MRSASFLSTGPVLRAPSFRGCSAAQQTPSDVHEVAWGSLIHEASLKACMEQCKGACSAPGGGNVWLLHKNKLWRLPRASLLLR